MGRETQTQHSEHTTHRLSTDQRPKAVMYHDKRASLFSLPIPLPLPRSSPHVLPYPSLFPRHPFCFPKTHVIIVSWNTLLPSPPLPSLLFSPLSTLSLPLSSLVSVTNIHGLYHQSFWDLGLFTSAPHH